MKQQKRTPEIQARSKRFLEIATLFLAVWGAGLSTWTSIQQRREEAPRVFVRFDLAAKESREGGEPACYMVATISNVGKSTVSVAPRISILATSTRTGKTFKTKASFGGAPATIEPGQHAVAKTGTLEVAALKAFDNFAVILELPDHTELRAVFVAPDYRPGEFRGWSGGALANEI